MYKKKHRWNRLARQNIITNRSYKEYEAELSSLLKMAENDYYLRKFNSLGSNSKINWTIINKIMGRKSENMLPKCFEINNVTINDEKSISNEFCKHFIEVPKKIHDSITTGSLEFLNNIPNEPNNMFLRPTTPNEISNIIMNLKKKVDSRIYTKISYPMQDFCLK